MFTGTLGYEVFVCDPIPMDVPGRLRSGECTAVTAPDDRFTPEDHELNIVEIGHADTGDSAVLHVPDPGLVVAGDAVRLVSETRQYLDNADHQLTALYARTGDVAKDAVMRWFHPLLTEGHELSQAVGLHETEPELARSRKRRNGVPHAVDGNFCGHSDRSGMEVIYDRRPYEGEAD